MNELADERRLGFHGAVVGVFEESFQIKSIMIVASNPIFNLFGEIIDWERVLKERNPSIEFSKTKSLTVNTPD